MPVMALTSGRQKFPPGTSFIMFCLNQPVIDQPLLICHSSLGALEDFVRPLRTHRRSWWPSSNVDCRGQPKQGFSVSVPFWGFLLGLMDTWLCVIPLGRAIALFLWSVLPTWCDPVTYIIATVMGYDQIKMISADCEPIHNFNANNSDTTSLNHYNLFMA